MKNYIDIVKVKLEVIGKLEERNIFSQPEDVGKFLKEYIGSSDREEFVVMCLDVRNKINNLSTVSIGNLNSALIHPREVFKTAILSNSATIIVGHNHPGGDVTPSRADEEVINNLVKVGKTLQIEVLDSLIVSHNDKYFSFKEEGLI